MYKFLDSAAPAAPLLCTERRRDPHEPSCRQGQHACYHRTSETRKLSLYDTRQTPLSRRRDVDDLRPRNRNPDPMSLGPWSWLFVDSIDYLRILRLQTLVICGHFRLSGWVL